MILSIQHLDGTRRIVRVSDKVLYSASTGRRLDDARLSKRLHISAQGLAGSAYKSHKILQHAN